MSHNNKLPVYSGTSGLVLPYPNKQMYPPEFQDKSRLTFYASLLNSIEINSSFYKVPLASTVSKWSESVPDGFKFTFKLWRDITHTKGLTFNEHDVERFMQTINSVGEKRGCLLVQFPPSLKILHAPQLERLIARIAEANLESPWKVALEFRDKSWYHEDIFELIQSYGMTVVVHDKPASATPMPEVEPEFVYLRFHGPDGSYRGSYTDDFLFEYAQYIQQWNEEQKMVFVYFNNTMGDAIKNLLTLNGYLEDMG